MNTKCRASDFCEDRLLSLMERSALGDWCSLPDDRRQLAAAAKVTFTAHSEYENLLWNASMIGLSNLGLIP